MSPPGALPPGGGRSVQRGPRSHPCNAASNGIAHSMSYPRNLQPPPPSVHPASWPASLVLAQFAPLRRAVTPQGSATCTHLRPTQAARLVPEKVPAGFVLAPCRAPLEVLLGGPAVSLRWTELSTRWSLPVLAGLVVQSPVHCWANVSGPRRVWTSGEMRAWQPSAREFGKGITLTLRAHKRGTARLWAFVADPDHLERKWNPLAEPVPMPPLLKFLKGDPMELFG
jgi:hypothetical protein